MDDISLSMLFDIVLSALKRVHIHGMQVIYNISDGMSKNCLNLKYWKVIKKILKKKEEKCKIVKLIFSSYLTHKHCKREEKINKQQTKQNNYVSA